MGKIRELDDELEILKYKQLMIAIKRYQVSLGGRKIKLTLKEFEILRCLLEKNGQVLTRQELHAHTKSGQTVIICDQTINTHIKNIKKKIGHYGQFIQSVRGVGYVFRE